MTFPDAIPVRSLENLKSALPPPTGQPDIEMDAETIKLQPFDESMRNTKATGGTQAAESDEEEESHPGGGQRVQCAQQ